MTELSAEDAACSAFAALAPSEVIDIDALGLGAGAYRASNKVVEAIQVALKAEFPVSPDFAAAFEEAEYLMALLHHSWHETVGRPSHLRRARKLSTAGLSASTAHSRP